MTRARFDPQAAAFDRRAGPPLAAVQAVADHIARLAHAADQNLVLDIGAGTGSVGEFVIRPGLRYIGLDLSLPMLQVFASKPAGPPPRAVAALLVVADADRTWPLAAGSAGVIFCSRSVHLLRYEHVAAETLRVASPRTAFFVIGRVRRSPDSVRAVLRGEMLRLLGGYGVAGRRSEEAHPRLATAWRGLDRHVREPDSTIAARWNAEETPGASLDAWRGTEGLAGVPVPAQVKQAVLMDLERWAIDRFGALHAVRTSEQQYELTIVETGQQVGA